MKRGRGLWAALLLVVLLLVPRGLWAIGEVTGRLGGVVTIDGTKDGLSGVPIAAPFFHERGSGGRLRFEQPLGPPPSERFAPMLDFDGDGGRLRARLS